MTVAKKIAEDEARLEMTPMIDVTFLLLVFFMATLQFKTLDGKLAAYLPKEAGSCWTEPEPSIDVRIFASEQGVSYSVGPKKVSTMETLRTLLQRYQAQAPDRPVAIGPAPGVDHGTTVGVLDTVLNIGFERVRFFTIAPANELP